MLRHRGAIIESIERRGISLNLGKTTVPVLSRFQYLRDILSMRSVSQVFGKLRHSWVWQSACLGIISLVGLIALRSTVGNPYGSLNEHQLGLFKVSEPYRGTLISEADSLFLQGENHYHGHQASLAIKELRRADELWGLNPKRPELYPRTRARYYLALCHLDLNRPTVAIEYLNWIVEQGDKTEYYEKARDKLERVLQIKKRIEQRQFKVWQWQFIRDLFHPKE